MGDKVRNYQPGKFQATMLPILSVFSCALIFFVGDSSR
jgi:hypothetical protein